MVVDQGLNPILASVKPSKTIAFTDMAMQMKEQGIDVRTHCLCVTCLSIHGYSPLISAMMEITNQYNLKHFTNSHSH